MHSPLYIEKYSVENKFAPDVFFKQFKPGVDYDPSWPLFVASMTPLDATSMERTWTAYLEGKRRARPSDIMNSSYGSIDRVIGHALGMVGPIHIEYATCASGAYLFYHAWATSLAIGTPVVVVCADNLTSYRAFTFKSIGALDEQTGISFDKRSRGFRPGAAQGFFVVSAKPIRPVAKISNMRFITAVDNLTDVGNAEYIIDHLIKGIDLSGVQWWNAHAPGTPVGDAAEYTMFKRVFGNKDIPISSLKSKFGHSVTSSYLFELGEALNSLRSGFIPCNENLLEPIVDDPRILKEHHYTNGRVDKFIKTSLGFNGKNVLSVVELL